MQNVGKKTFFFLLLLCSLYIAKTNPDIKKCDISGTGLTNFDAGAEVTVSLAAKDSAGDAITTGGSIFVLDVRDYCVVDKSVNPFVCTRVGSTDSKYNEDIFPSAEDYIYKIFTDKSDGNYDVNFQILSKGWITVQIFMLTQGGLTGQYYNNVWFNGSPELQKVDEKINFNWGSDNIFNVYNSNVGIRWVGAIKSIDANEYIFSVVSDDGVRVFIHNKLVLDHLTSVCDDSEDTCKFSYSMEANTFYHIVIEYVQKDGTSAVSFYWETSSMSKVIVPKENLYYYELSPNSPYAVQVSSDKGYGPNCLASGDGISFAYAGKEATFTIQSVDVRGNNINSQNDAYVVEFNDSNDQQTSVVATVTYDSTANSGLYQAKYTATQIGTFKLHVKLDGFEIQSSPFTVTVLIGEPSAAKSQITNFDSAADIKAGIAQTLTLELYDPQNNKFTSNPPSDPEITAIAEWVDSNDYISPLGVADLDGWETTIGKKFAGSVKSNNDGTYKITFSVLKAGKFNLYVKIKGDDVNGTPYSIKVTPAELDACKCVFSASPSTSVQCGTELKVQYQCRDSYSNNIKDTLDALPSGAQKSFTIVAESGYSETGTITDIADKNGCYEIAITPKKAGKYTAKILLENHEIPEFEFVANPDPTVSKGDSISEISDSRTEFVAGEYITVNVYSYDQFQNLITTDTQSVYKITINSQDWGVSEEKTADSQGNGKFTSTFQLTKASTYTIKVSLDGTDIKNSPYTIKIVPNIAGDKSTITTTPQSIVVGTKNIFKASLSDSFGNHISAQQDEQVALDFKLSPYTESTESTIFIGAYSIGSYTFSDVYFEKAGTYSYVLRIINNFGLRGSYYRNVDFYNKDELVALNYHDFGIKYTRTDETIDFNLGYDSFFTGFPNKLFSVVWEGYIKPKETAIYTLSFAVDGRVALYIDDKLAISYSTTADKTSSDTENFVNVNLDKDKYTPIKIEYIKGTGVLLTKIQFFYESDNIQKQIIPKSVLYSAVYSSKNDYAVDPGETDPNSIKIIGDYNTCVTGAQNEINFQIFDRFGNQQKLTDNFVVTLTSLADQTSQTATVTGNAGSYKAKYQITKSGNYKLSITVTPASGVATLVSSFETIQCGASTVDPSKTEVEGEGTTQATAGTTAEFTITLYDANKNIVDSFNNVNVEIKPSGEDDPISSVVTYDKTTNKYLCQYVAYKAKEHVIEITVNDDTVNKKTSTVTVSPGLPSSTKSKYENIKTSYQMDTDSSYDIILVDDYDNNVVKTYQIYSEISGNFGLTKVECTQDANDKSKYTSKFNIQRVSDVYSGCGNAEIASYAMESGIKREIYNNYWMNGAPIKSTTESLIDYTYEEDDVIVEGYDKMYSSISFNFYVKPQFEEKYTFIVTTNNNVRLFIDGECVIDSFDKVLQEQYTYSISLKKNTFYNARLNIYIAEETSNIKAEWYSASQAIQEISSTNSFYAISTSPIALTKKTTSVQSKPSKITTFSEGAKDTYKYTSVTMVWKAPDDNGCSEITGYKIKKFDSGTSSYTDLADAQPPTETYEDADGIAVDTTYKYKIYAINAIGDGIESDEISCTSLSLPSAPKDFAVKFNEKTATITWSAPEDTGAGAGTSIAILRYYVEYRKKGASDYKVIYSGNLLTTTENNFVYGTEYQFQVAAETKRGIGAYATLEKICSAIPSKPKTPPMNDPTVTSQTQIGISYLPITETNGSPIVKYKVYLSKDIKFTQPTAVENALNLIYTFTTDIEKGKTYYVKYSAFNDNGESELSEMSLPIIAGVKPGAPTNLVKVTNENSALGTITVNWGVPADDGGAAVVGYNIYLNSILKAKVDNNINEYTFTDLSSKIPYTVSLSCYNSIGTSDLITLTDVYATVLPKKVSKINLLSHSQTEIKLDFSVNDDGGSVVTGYDIKKDNEAQISSTEATYTFTVNQLVNNFKIRANNANGNGPWSDIKTFYAASQPDPVSNFAKVSQKTTEIVLSWENGASDGGCDISGYEVLVKSGKTSTASITLNADVKTLNFNSAYNIQPSIEYFFSIVVKNCAYESTPVELTVYSASVPDTIQGLALKNVKDTTTLVLEWDNTFYNGGMPILQYKIYKDGAEAVSITDIRNNGEVPNLTRGTEYKFTITSLNVVGESSHSQPLVLVFADRPSQPQDVAIDVTTDRAVLTWKAPADGNGDDNFGYKIYISGSVSSSDFNTFTLVHDTNKQKGIFSYSYDVSKFQINEKYYAKIVAYNCGGDSDPTGIVFTFANKPSKPAGLRVKDIDTANFKITLTFQVPSNGGNAIKYYKINKEGTDEAKEYPTNVIEDSYDNSKVIGDTLNYKVKAVNSVGESEYSDVLSFKISSKPNAPSNLKIKERPSKTSAVVSWDLEASITNNAPTLGYNLYLTDVVSSIIDEINTSISTITNYYTLTNLTPGRKYKVLVRTVNEIGESVNSNEVDFTAGTVPSKINTLSIDSTKTTTTKIVISFEPPQDDGGTLIEKYNFYIIKDLTANTEEKQEVSVTTFTEKLEYEISSLTKGQKISVSISSSNTIGESEKSEKYLFNASVKPGAPKGFSVSSLSISSSDSATAVITWSTPDDDGGSAIEKYMLYIDNFSEDDKYSYQLLSDDINIWNLQYTITPLVLGETYNVKIYAVNSNGISDALLEKFLAALPPLAPTELSVVSTSDTEISITWNAPAKMNGSVITYYTIYLTETDTKTEASIKTDSILTEYTIKTNIQANKQYKIRVAAVNAKGESSKSNTVTAYAAKVPSELSQPVIEEASRTLSSFKVTWTKPTKSDLTITGYDVLIDDGSGKVPFNTVYSGRYINNILYYTIDGLTSGVKYNVAFVAYNAAGKSALSPILEVICGTKPKPPSNLYIKEISSTAIKVAFTPPTNTGGVPLIKYKVSLNGGAETDLDYTNNEYSIDPATEGSEYTIQISSVNSIGESEKVQIKTKAVNKPDAPVLKLASSNSNYCSLTWEAITPPTSSTLLYYTLYTDNGSSSQPSTSIYTGPNQSHIHSNLETNKVYQYTLTATNEVGESQQSTIVICRTSPIANAPTDLRVVESSTTHIKVQWSPPALAFSEIASYILYVQKSGEVEVPYKSSWQKIYEGSDLSYDYTDVTSKSLYDFKVTDVDDDGRESISSDVRSFYAASPPAKINALTVEHNSRNSIIVKWTTPAVYSNEVEVVQYKVKLSSDSGTKEEIVSNALGVTEFVVDNLEEGKEYKVSVCGLNIVGEGEYSEEKTITAMDYPSPPQNLKVKLTQISDEATKADTTIEWTEPEDTGGVDIKYYVLVYKDTTAGTAEVEVDQITETFKKIEKLTIGNVYTFKVYSFNGLKSKTSSSELQIKVGLVPEKITTASVESRTRTSIKIKWEAPNNNGNDITLYNIYNDNEELIGSSQSAVYDFDGLTQGNYIQIRISSVNVIGESEISDIYKFKIFGKPDPPLSIKVTSFSKTKVSLSWYPTADNGGDDVTKYHIFRGINGESINSLEEAGSVGSNILTYDDTNVAKGKKYDYYIASENGDGIGSYSLPITVTAISPPSNFNTITPTISDIDSQTLYVQWEEVPETGGTDITYELYYKPILANAEFSLVYSGYGTFYQLNSLTPGNSYIFKVVAKNDAGEDSSSESSPHLCGSLPSKPLNLRLVSRKDTTLSNENSIKIKWDSPTVLGTISLTGYNVYKSTDGVTFTAVDAATSKNNPNVVEFEDKDNIQPGTYYDYYITAVNAFGEGPSSDYIRILAGEIPRKPTTDPVFTPSVISSSINIKITELTANNPVTGSILPTRYIIKMDSGNTGNSWSVVSDGTSTTVDIPNLTVGMNYRFIYAVSNKVYDMNNLNNEVLEFSDEYNILLASLPCQVGYIQTVGEYADKVELEWLATSCGDIGSPILNYVIKETDKDGTSKDHTVSSSFTSYNVKDLIPGQKYSFTIKAKNTIGDGPESYSLSYTPGKKPFKMNSLTIESFTKDSAKLKWTIPTGIETGGTINNPLEISSFSIYMNDTIIQTVVGTLDSYEATGLQTGTLYNFTITCTNLKGESEKSVHATVIPSTYPSAPVNLIADYQSNKNIHLTWQEPYDDGGLPVFEYELQIQEKGGTALPFEHIKDLNFVFNSDKGIQSKKEYEIKIRAHNSFSIQNKANNNWSETITAFSSNSPSKVSGLTSSDVSKFSVKLTWPSLTTDEETGYSTTDITYELEASTIDKDEEYKVVYKGKNTEYSHSVTTTGKAYYFRLRSKNNVGYSDYSSTMSVMLGSVPNKMNKMTLISRSALDISGANPFINVQWKAPADNGGMSILGYKIVATSDEAPQKTTTYELNRNDIFNYKFSPCTKGVKYSFTASARNQVGYSEPSIELDVICANVPGQTSLTQDTTALSKTDITVKWTAPNYNGGIEITGYVLQYKLDYETDEMFQSIDIDSKDTLTKKVDNLISGYIYSFRIAAKNKVYTDNKINEDDELQYSDIVEIPCAVKPGQPENFEQDKTNLLEDAVTLSWEEPTDNGGMSVQSYTILKETSTSGEYAELATVVSDASSGKYRYIDYSIMQSSQKYKIYCSSIVGDSELSNEITAYSGLTPSAVKNLKIKTVTQNSIVVSWEEPETSANALFNQITGYSILLQTPTKSYEDAAESVNLEKEYSITNIDSQYIGKQYSFIVYAANILGEGEKSLELTTYLCGEPGEPTIKVYKRGAHSITLQFAPNAEKGGTDCIITKFKLYRDSVLITENDSNIVTYVDSNVINGNQYKYKIVYYNNAENSNEKEIEVTIGTVPEKPYDVKLVSSDNSGNLAISWKNNNGENTKALIDKDLIYIDDGNGVYGNAIEHTDLTKLEYKFTGLVSGKTYKVKIVSHNVIGNSEESLEKSFIIASPSSAPKNLKVVSSTSSDVNLLWENPEQDNGSTVTGYNLYINRKGLYAKENESSISSTVTTIKSLEKGKKYSIYVTAINAAGESIKSNVEQFIAADPPSAPRNLFIQSSTTDSVTIGWEYSQENGGSNIEKYEVYWKVYGEGDWQKLDETDTYTLEITHSRLKENTYYQYKVRAVSSKEGAFSDPITVQLTTGAVLSSP